MPISVSSIQSYNPSSSWFNLDSYSQLGLNERNPLVSLPKSNLWLIDVSQLVLSQDYAPRIAFINEGAAYENKIGLTATFGNKSESVTLFKNLSGSNSILPSSNAPLKLGDWVQLSKLTAGTQINLNIFPNGGSKSLSTNPDLNPTNPYNTFSPVFWVAYADPFATNPLFLLGFEDIVGPGTDNDYNDGILALDLGLENFNKVYQNYNFGQPTAQQLANSGGLDGLTSAANYVSPTSLPTPTASRQVPLNPETGLTLIALALLALGRQGIRQLMPRLQQRFPHGLRVSTES